MFAAQLGKALAPKEVLFVGDIPKTRNAKVMRRIVRAAYLGDTSALENPGSLDEIKRVAERTYRQRLDAAKWLHPL